MLPDRVKPCIAICVFNHSGCERKIREVQAGMEEEGIPYMVMPGEDRDVIALSNQAACASKLGVGVGIGPEGLSIQTDKLPAKEPLFLLTNPGTLADWRNFGYNAARLVKGIPFKKQSEETESQEQDSTELYLLVRDIVQKILREGSQVY
ncbi:MAG TPA: glycerol dehydratase reactivase beta/small subunit family protein [Negativicutes bacterium]|nr:glycerol dehydratase reactivase beta/small subunit family protein [Negativicutes bacterium]